MPKGRRFLQGLDALWQQTSCSANMAASSRRHGAAAALGLAVIGRNGSGDVVSATRMAWLGCSFGWPRPRRSGAGTNIPTARKSSCETGTRWRKLGLSDHEIPRHSAGCSWPTLTGGLWHFWGSGSVGSCANRRKQCGVVSLSHAIASLEAGKSPVGPHPVGAARLGTRSLEVFGAATVCNV